MAVVSATSRHFQRNDMMIADVSHEIEWVTMQLLSLKTKSGKREAGFIEYFDKDILHFVKWRLEVVNAFGRLPMAIIDW